MKIITSHERADMDALASMYAATLLYPEHVAILPQKLNRNLRDLIALYRDELPFVERRELQRRHISEVVLVDTTAIAPLRGMNGQTRIIVIDHHIPEEPTGDRPAQPPTQFIGEPMGATTTLIAEMLQGRGLRPSRLGASLMLMGIYEDTGNLTYSGTTARDARAAAWLLEQGADLLLVDQFLNRPLSPEQRHALAVLLERARIETVHGRAICIAGIKLDDYVDELSSLIHQIMDVYEPDGCFMLAEYDGNVQIIGRSVTDAMDVAEILREFGGGGHSKAAAAHVNDATLEAIHRQLYQMLEQHVRPPVLVREIMSTNVHTLNLDISVRDAAQLMGRYGHEGFPVVDRDRLVGIITRRDIDRALHHRLGDMPVRSFLHTGPVYVRPGDAVSEVQRVMIDHNLGQVPVAEEGQFIGIVTRTDLIKLWSPSLHPSRAQEIHLRMERALPDPLYRLLIQARDVADELGYSLYIVGGFVRDLLLGSPTLDLDMVVEGDAIQLAYRLARRIGGRVRSHARFGTAKVILEGEHGAGVPPSLDFATARTEFYERPTVLPQVERSSIKQDLYRRDFTINTMAICLDSNRYGELLDYYGGERDILQGRIRVLHNLSFVEDPTRILRAVRFEQRLGFSIERRTEELITDALELLDHVTGERLRNELYLLLAEAEPERALERLDRMGALSHLHPSLRFSREMAQLFVRLRRRGVDLPAPAEGGRRAPAADGEAEDESLRPPTLSLCYLALLTSVLSRGELEESVERLHISERDAQLLHEVVRLRESLGELTAKVMLPSAIYHLLRPYSREARFVLSVLTDSKLAKERLDLYERELARVRLAVDGHYLRGLRIPPGPIYRTILARTLDAVLDREVTTPEEQRALARRLAETAHSLAAEHRSQSDEAQAD